MFNRQGFNRGRFNVSASRVFMCGVANMSLVGQIDASISIFAPHASTAVSLDTQGLQKIRLHVFSPVSSLEVGLRGTSRISLFAHTDIAILIVDPLGQPRRILRIQAPLSANLSILSGGSSLRRLFSPEDFINIIFTAHGKETVRLHSPNSTINLSMRAIGKFVRLLHGPAAPVRISLGVFYMRMVSGVADMALRGHIAAGLGILAPGAVAHIAQRSHGRQFAKLHGPDTVSGFSLDTQGLGRRGLFGDVSANITLGGLGILSRQVFSRGIAELLLDMHGGLTRHFHSQSDNGFINITADGLPLRRLFPNTPHTTLFFRAKGMNPTRRLFGNLPPADMILSISAHGTRRIQSVSSQTLINIVSSGLGLRRLITGITYAAFSLIPDGIFSRRLNPTPIPATIRLSADGTYRIRFFAVIDAKITLDPRGRGRAFVFSTIELPGLLVPRNGTLTIDTDEMAVMLDGEDVTRFFGRDSEFFMLRPGDNVITYSDGVAARNVGMTILWKDRWI